MEKFILEEGQGDWWVCNDVVIYYCRFSLEAYRRSLYDEFTIPFVKSLQRAVDKRQAEYLAGRYCANKALDLIGLKVTGLPTGKHREPLWPTGVVGSISHSNEVSSVCVSRNINISGLGIDLEKIVNSVTMEKIRDSVLTEDDKLILTTANIERVILFSIIFSVKESFFKAAFPQVKRYFDFDAISVINVDEVSQEVHCRINYKLSESLLEGTLVTAKYHYIDHLTVMTLVKLSNLSFE